MQKIRILENTIQEYEWGSYTSIAGLLGLKTPSEKPQAELWMGAHPKAPSIACLNDDKQRLDQLIEGDPENILGKAVSEKFSGKLPFLFKVLAARKPLSIQVHPKKKQAEEGFVRENKLGIPIDAPNRNYRDDNHKPEIICALTPFWAMNGFRNPAEILNLVEKVAGNNLETELAALRIESNNNGLREFFHSLMVMDKDRQTQVVSDSLKLAEKLKDNNPAYSWMVRLHDEYPGDIGIFSPLILNLVHLQPGEAMFLEAGVLHAYLEGTGMELMANSDNVLRGGLTPKHIDLDELFKIVKFEHKPIEILKPHDVAPAESSYKTPADEFALSVLEIREDSPFQSSQNRGIEIMICVDGDSTITDSHGNSTPFHKGTSVMVPASLDSYTISGNATIYKASVPLK